MEIYLLNSYKIFKVYLRKSLINLRSNFLNALFGLINLDKDNNIVGIDINQASRIINLSELEVSDIPHKSGS